MTDAPNWRTYVEAMINKAKARQNDLFYRLSLPGWQAELQRLKGGDDQTPQTTLNDMPHMKGHETHEQL